jgi:hypothetical protein
MVHTHSQLESDGNAVAGLLQEFFVNEVTTAQAKCSACSATSLIGALIAYAVPMGAVLRCPHCEHILIRAVRTSHGRWLEMTGAVYVRF